MNISFGSNYVINQGRNFAFEAIDEIEELQDVEISQEYTPFEEACKTGVFSKFTLNAPDDLDNEIERILIYNNINFSKTSTKDALKLENILSRIRVNPYDESRCKLVLMDTDVLNELFKKDGISYIEPNGTNGLGDRYNGFCNYLKTGKSINATRITLNNFDGELSASIGDGRHRFAVLRDMGMKKIPVALDNDSIEVAKEFGLI